MAKAKFSSKVSAFFLRLFLIVSWLLLLISLLFAVILVIYPNVDFLQNINNLTNKGIGVWRDINTKELSTVGIIFICIVGFSLVYSIVMQIISKNVKYTIGKYNRVLGYFTGLTIFVTLFSIFVFLGTGNFGFSVPSVENSQTLLFTRPLIGSEFPFLTSGLITWVWLIALIIGGSFIIMSLFTTVFFLIKIIFHRTHDKKIANSI